MVDVSEVANKNRNIVPFGKYKGQPVDVLAADQAYCEWLRCQPWFAEKFRDVYNIVINYGNEPQDTPEHNALQARFLDDEFCVTVGRASDSESRLSVTEKDAEYIVDNVAFESYGWDVKFRLRIFFDKTWLGTHEFIVECKPHLGDDYPSVLRQMQGNMATRMVRPYTISFYGCVPILLVGSFSATGATLDQVRKIFASSNIRLVMLDDVLAHMEPA